MIMRAPATILTALALAGVGLVAAPAAADEPPWQPATDLYSHMTGQDGGGGFDEAVRDMVTDSIKEAAPDFVDPWVDPAAQQAAPAAEPSEDAGRNQQPAPDEWQAPADDGADDATDGGTPQDPEAAADPEGSTAWGSEGWQGSEPSDDWARWEDPQEPHYTGHPLPAEGGNPRRVPCVEAGGALVEVREHTGGQVQPLGVACVAPEHAGPDRRTIIREAARREVRGMDLPGGWITAAPDEGLAWLETKFRLRGATRGPATLTIHGARVGVRFIPVVRAWGFGDGEGADGGTTVEHVYRHAGRYQVTARTVWTARVTLDGRPLTSVTGLVSGTGITYPVSELRAVLTD